MVSDVISLLMRFVLLQLIAATSELAIKKRLFFLSVLLFGLWVTIFRLTISRAIKASVGVFHYTDSGYLKYLNDLAQSSPVANVTDFFLLIGVIVLFRFVIHYPTLNKGVKRNVKKSTLGRV